MSDTFDPNCGPSLPLQTTAEEQTDIIERDHAALADEQDKRETFVNSVEHGAKTFLADIEKVAARKLKDANGYPVLRREYVDDASGIPSGDMVSLLRNYGRSSKAGTVFSGNHGMGLILANGTANPAGLAILTKTADADEPYMAYWWKDPFVEQYSLRTFWVSADEEDEEKGSWEPVIELTTFDGIDWAEVWKTAYDNPKFKGVPESGTVIVEIGKSRDLTDSTYLMSQQTRNEQTGVWAYSRWAMGQYYNAHFWTLPIDTFWGVPGSDKVLSKKPTLDGRPHWATTTAFLAKWNYRKATGLYEQMSIVTKGKSDDDDDGPAQTTRVDEATIANGDAVHLTDSPIPVTVEVYVRHLPPGIEARKFNFQVRRRGKVVLDYNDELFEAAHLSPHSLFSLVRKQAQENVWLRIIPDHMGDPTPGNVWMKGGRDTVKGIDAYGGHIDLPWREWGAEFRENMPKILVDFLKSLDHDMNLDLTDKAFSSWWEKVIGDGLEVRSGMKTGTTGTTKKLVSHRANPNGDEFQISGGTPEHQGGTHGPAVNPGTHPKGGRNGERIKRRVPGKGPHQHEADVPGPGPQRKPKAPFVKWIEDADEWPTDEKWGVVWEEPSTANDLRGRVLLHWNYWWVQDFHLLLLDEIRDATSPYPRKALQQVLGRSVATKIGHRRNECANRVIGINPEEREAIFSPAALTGFLLGRYDHWATVLMTLGGMTAGAKGRDGLDEDDEDAVA